MSDDIKKYCQDIVKKILEKDSFLTPYADSITDRILKIRKLEQRLTCSEMSLREFASGHEYFGLHYFYNNSQDNGWVLREWAPNASKIYLVGDLSGWQEKEEFKLKRINSDGVWEIILPFDALSHKDFYRLRVHWPGGAGDRIPAYARRVVQDPVTLIFNAQVWHPPTVYQ